MSLDSRIKSLISIGVSVGVNCQPCLDIHVAKAKEIGISEEEMQEAITVGRSVKKGAAYKMEQFAAGLFADTSTIPEPADTDCACGCGESCA